MKPPKCRLCGAEHWSHEAHVFNSKPASNSHLTTASNTTTASNNDSAGASNIHRGSAVLDEEGNSESGKSGERGRADADSGGVDSEQDGRPGSSVVSGRVSKQRWDRDKYNAYQREYMRKRRAVTALDSGKDK